MRPSRILRRWIGTRSGNATDRRTVRGRRRRVRGGRRKRLPKWWHVASRVPTRVESVPLLFEGPVLQSLFVEGLNFSSVFFSPNY